MVMGGLSFCGTDRKDFSMIEATQLACEVVEEIILGQYDGYICRSTTLVGLLEFYLSQNKGLYHWRIRSDLIHKSGVSTHRIWVERAGNKSVYRRH